MARKSKQDVAKAKAAKQKKILIVAGVVFVLLLAIQVPRTMKMMNKKAAPPVATPTSTTPAPTSTTAASTPSSTSLAAPSLAVPTSVATSAPASSDLVSAVPVTADPGQLRTFERFASKDPFSVQVSGASGAAKAATSKPAARAASTGTKTSGAVSGTAAPPPTIQASTPAPSAAPAAPAAPTSAVVSLNGELMSVTTNTDFPTTGATFARLGSMFHLKSLTATTAKIAIVGGSYASGAPAITLHLKVPLTLQNTADGTKYTLILEPPGTPLTPASSTPVAPATTTTLSPVVPATGNGG
jgi:hypothetical protein